MKKLSIALLLSLVISTSSFAFNDTENHENKEAINYIEENGIVNGYEDGSFKPENLINRAEFTKILIEAKLKKNPISSASNCFTDIQSTDWFASYICYAKLNGMINGHPDGSFKPANKINLAEASTILSNVFKIETDSNNEQWYRPYVNGLANKNYLPSNFKFVTQEVTRAQMAEMIWRIIEDIQTEPSSIGDQILDRSCSELEENIPENIDINLVREAWLSWYNAERTANGLSPYTYNSQLHRTGVIWSEEAKRRGYIDHKRAGQSAYYDYNIITNWFKGLGLVFQNINRITYTESIAWNSYSCDKEDCTQDFINRMRPSFDFFMSEKGMAYRPHYNAIVNPTFTEMGLGIAIDESKGKYYLTSHFGTHIISDPDPICD